MQLWMELLPQTPELSATAGSLDGFRGEPRSFTIQAKVLPLPPLRGPGRAFAKSRLAWRSNGRVPPSNEGTRQLASPQLQPAKSVTFIGASVMLRQAGQRRCCVALPLAGIDQGMDHLGGDPLLAEHGDLGVRQYRQPLRAESNTRPDRTNERPRTVTPMPHSTAAWTPVILSAVQAMRKARPLLSSVSIATAR